MPTREYIIVSFQTQEFMRGALLITFTIMNDSLFVEEIDLGDVGVRQVVSGLAKYMKEEDMMVYINFIYHSSNA